ncbi:hypothetical protein J5491_03010 [Candidatus Saccharibacteria bacterium]|nr:hypothetical protein [Candidatus Saccharibacteria bacterium]
MKMFKKFVVLMLVAALLLGVSVPVFAAAKQPYKDVICNGTVNSVDYKAIIFLKKYGAYKGIVKGEFFYPDKPITGRIYFKIARRLFGKKNVPMTKADKKKLNKKVSNLWVAKKNNAIIKKLGGVSNDLPTMTLNKVTKTYISSSFYGLIKYHKEVRRAFKKNMKKLASAN